MKCCLKQKLATKHRPISKECFICRMAYMYKTILWYCLKAVYIILWDIVCFMFCDKTWQTYRFAF